VLDTHVAWLTYDEYVSSSPDPSRDGWPDAQLPPETLLPSCPERSVGLSLPLPISARLDLLVALAEQVGERTSRKEIVAACILGSPDGAEELVGGGQRERVRVGEGDRRTASVREHRVPVDRARTHPVRAAEADAPRQ